MSISQIRNSTLEELLDIDLTTLNMVELEVISAAIREKVSSLQEEKEGLMYMSGNYLSASCDLINSILTCAQESSDNKALMAEVIEAVMSWRKKHPRVFAWEDYPYYESITPKCIFDFLVVRKLH